PLGVLRRDHRGAGAEERIVDRLARLGVVEDRPAHHLDRLLGRVDGLAVLLVAAERAGVGDLPDGRLLAVAEPVAGLPLADRVPAGLMGPVIMAAGDREVLLHPYDLRAALEAERIEHGCGL